MVCLEHRCKCEIIGDKAIKNLNDANRGLAYLFTPIMYAIKYGSLLYGVSEAVKDNPDFRLIIPAGLACVVSSLIGSAWAKRLKYDARNEIGPRGH